MIITNSGAEIEITHACIFPIWIERPPGRIVWHYHKPKDADQRRSKYEEWPYWFYKATYKNTGRAAYDGRWNVTTNLRADDGTNEINKQAKDTEPRALAQI